MRRGIISSAVLLLWFLLDGAIQAREDAFPKVELSSSRPTVVHIKPGTFVGRKPPKQWSHLVIKSLPRLSSGDLNTLPDTALRTAALFRTVILADVKSLPQEPQRYVLRRIGVGLCAPNRQGRDVVVEPSWDARVGVDLSMMDRMVLDAAEGELRRGRITASTSTFALYRAPAALAVGDEHHNVEMFYAFLIDQENGDLKTLVWALDTTLSNPPAPLQVVELPPSLVYDCPLDVEAKRLLRTVPVSWSFAMTELPPGRARGLTRDLARYLATALRNPIEPVRLERALRLATSDGPQVSGPVLYAPSEVRAAAAGSGLGQSEQTWTSGSGRPGTRLGAR
ncbi:MAG: hypothetical protein ACLP7Q_27585 [Isosphaeraceae bacterium]